MPWLIPNAVGLSAIIPEYKAQSILYLPRFIADSKVLPTLLLQYINRNNTLRNKLNMLRPVQPKKPYSEAGIH